MNNLFVVAYGIQIGYIILFGAFQVWHLYQKPRKKHAAYMLLSYMLVLLFVLWVVMFYSWLIPVYWKVLLFISFCLSYNSIYRMNQLTAGSVAACSSPLTSVNSESL